MYNVNACYDVTDGFIAIMCSDIYIFPLLFFLNINFIHAATI